MCFSSSPHLLTPALRSSRWVGAFVLAVVTSTAQSATVTVDPSIRHQTILGWGATCTPLVMSSGARDRLLDAAVNDFGLTRLRFEIPRREWEDGLNDNDDPEKIEWRAFRTRSTDDRVLNWILPFKRLVEKNGDPFNLYISPSFFDGGSSGSAPPWLLDNPAEYAEWASAFLIYLRDRHGLIADFYSICNEAGNNNAFTAEVLRRNIKALGPKLISLGLPTKIEFSEGVNSAATWSYIQAARNDAEVWKAIGVLSYHLYGDGSKRTAIRDFGKTKGLPTAQTEYMGTTFRDLYEDLTLGGVSYWEHYGLAGPNATDATYFSTNLPGNAFEPYSQSWNFRQVMRYVRPGAVRLETVSDDPAVKALAFENDGRFTMVLWNSSGSSGKSVVVKGLPAGEYGHSEAKAGAPREKGVHKSIPDGSIEVSVAAGGIATLYPHDGNLAPVLTSATSRPEFLHRPSSRVTLAAVAVDPETDAMKYEWVVESAPDGASVTLVSPASATTSASGLTAPGSYVFRVTAGDGSAESVKRVEVLVFDGNQPPVVVDLHNRLPVHVSLPGGATELRGGGFDLEGDPLTLRWSIVSQPAGADALLGSPEKGQCKVTRMTVAGEYLFRLDVSDPAHTVSKTHAVTVYPNARLSVLRGDVNGDSKIDVGDAVLALRALVGLMALNDWQLRAVDMTEDGRLSLADLQQLVSRAVA